MTDVAKLAPVGRPDLHNLEIEQALLAGLLFRNETLDGVSDFLRPEHFAEPVHGRIYGAIIDLVSRGHVANPLTLRGTFEDDETLRRAGGAQYLVRLCESVVTTINVPDYGRIVYDLAIRRALRSAGDDMATLANDQAGVSTDEAIRRAQTMVFDLADPVPEGARPVGLTVALDEALAHAQTVYRADGRVIGRTTGLPRLDRAIGGLHDSDLILIAGRPGMGKTALGTTIALNAARAELGTAVAEGRPPGRVGFFSLEMTREQIAMRLNATVCGISAEKQRNGPLTASDMDDVIDAAERLRALPLDIDHAGAAPITQIRARAQRMKRHGRLIAVVVDYIQLMVGGSDRGGYENRTQEVSTISRSLKSMAKELRVPVVALSQLSRETEKRDDKRPQLADLRESGSLEQDADIVLFPYRAEYYLDREKPTERRSGETEEAFSARLADWFKRRSVVAGTADIIVAKNRHGRCGVVRVRFDGERTLFAPLASDESQPDVLI